MASTLTSQELWDQATEAQDIWYDAVEKSFAAASPCQMARMEAIGEVAYCTMVELAKEAAKRWFQELDLARNNK